MMGLTLRRKTAILEEGKDSSKMSINYETVSSPNYAAYANPGFGMKLGQMLQDIPDQYMKGRENKRAIEKQDAFKGGMPVQKDASGNPVLDANGNPIPDTKAIIDAGFKYGGMDYAAQMLPYLGGQATASRQSEIDNGILGYGASSPSYPSAENKSAAGPGNIGGVRPSQPRLSSAGADNEGADTLRSVITELRGADNDSTPVISAAARTLRINPDRPLTPDQATQVRSFVGSYAQARPQGSSEDISPPTGATSAADRGLNGPGGVNAAPLPASGASGAPAPSAGAARSPAAGQAPSTPGEPAEENPAVLRAVAAVLPPGVNPRGYQNYVRGLNIAIQRTLDNAADAARFPNGAARATQLQEKAKMYAGIRDRVLDAAKAAAEPTPEIRNAIASGAASPEEFERNKEIAKHQVEEATKRYSQIEKSGTQAEELEPQVRMARSLVNSPGFNSGIGRPFTDTIQQLGATLFGDPNMATPGQFFDKLRAGSILNEIRSLGGSGAGPVRVAEMKFIDTLYAGRDMQPASIRAVVEVENRLTQRAKAIYQMAQDYQQKHKILDDGFNREVSNYKSKHALFSEAELAHPDLLAMPVFSSAAQMRASQMPKGTKFRTPDGQVGVIP
jgi:hypothetical protein